MDDLVAQHLEQLVLQTGDLATHLIQAREGDLTHTAGLQGDGRVVALIDGNPTQPQDLAGQMEAGHQLIAIIAGGIGLKRARTHAVDGLDRLTLAKQVITPTDGTAFLDQLIQQF